MIKSDNSVIAKNDMNAVLTNTWRKAWVSQALWKYVISVPLKQNPFPNLLEWNWGHSQQKNCIKDSNIVKWQVISAIDSITQVKDSLEVKRSTHLSTDHAQLG